MSEQAVNQNEVAEAAVYLFRKWTQEIGLSDKEQTNAKPADFLAWVRDRMPPLNPFEIIAGMEGKCNVNAVELLFQVANDPNGPMRIMSMWPYMIMINRTNKHKLRSFQFLTVLTYEDDVVAPLSIFAHQDVVEGPIDDGAVITFMTAKVPEQTARITNEGLDSIHDTYAKENLGPIEDTLTQISEFMKGVRKSLPTPDSEAWDWDRVEKTLTFLASMFPKEVPPEMKQQLKKMGEAQAKQEGGWDVPE